jgi:hypothetical protein
MTYDEIDEETMVSQREAIKELEKHGKEIEVLPHGELWSVEDCDTICEMCCGEYFAIEILNWLGY